MGVVVVDDDQGCRSAASRVACPRFLAGEMGALKHCLIGNLLQFNPDDGSPVHCNCKRANYTHVSRPVDITRNESWGDQLLSVVASPLQPEHPLQLVFSIPTGQTSTWRKKLCTRRTRTSAALQVRACVRVIDAFVDLGVKIYIDTHRLNELCDTEGATKYPRAQKHTTGQHNKPDTHTRANVR